MILGIDEAGRGPAIGPLVLCGVRIENHRIDKLSALGVKDSKTFGSGPRARLLRSQLADKISKIATITIRIANAHEVDQWVENKGLNHLEREMALSIINEGPSVSMVIADGERLFSPLKQHCAVLEAIDKADQKSLPVAAASIVAKVKRDALMEQIFAPFQSEFGPVLGGGYPNFATEKFLRAYVKQCGTLPPHVRQSWSWKVLVELQNKVESSTRSEL